MARPTPTLSVVATSRNDDHGGSLLRRMQIFVSGFIAQCQRHNLPAELILVEWNPPPERPKFIDALRWPADPAPCTVRIVEVPPALHGRLRHAAALPLFQMIAKNVGIRRAQGEFILATNIDILFSDELMRFMAAGRLMRGRMYRVDRYDVQPDVPVEAPVSEQLAFCCENLLRVNALDGSFNVTPDGRRVLGADDIAAPDCGLSPGEGWYMRERGGGGEICRWVRSPGQFALTAPPGAPRAVWFDLESGPGVDSNPFILHVLDAAGALVARGMVAGCQRIRLQLPTAPGETRTFTFVTPDGGRPTAGDARVLDFRVLGFGWAPPEERAAAAAEAAETAPDRNFRATALRIDVAGEGLRFGRNWHYPECFRGELLRWVANDAEIDVQVTDERCTLLLELAPGPSVEGRPFELQVRSDTGAVLARTVVHRRQTLEFILPLAPGATHKLKLHVVGGDSRVHGEPRILNFAVFRCEQIRGSGRLPDAPGMFNVQLLDARPDIFPADAASVCGPGWYDYETQGRDETGFRWADNDAVIMVRTFHAPPRVLKLELETGPSAAGRPLELCIRDEEGHDAARAVVRGRQVLEIELPLRPDALNTFRLHVIGSGRLIEGDSRILNLRVYRAEWLAAPQMERPTRSDGAKRVASRDLISDITPPHSGIALGAGWHAFEYHAGETFRWLGPEAEIAVRSIGEAPNVLCLELAPGPGVGDQPFDLEILDEAGHAVATGHVDGRCTLELPLPRVAGRLQLFRLHAVGGGRSVDHDVRILNCRAFRCEWLPGERRPVAIGAASRRSDSPHAAAPAHHSAGPAEALSPLLAGVEAAVAEDDRTDIFDAATGIRLGRGWGLPQPHPRFAGQSEMLREIGAFADLYVHAPLDGCNALRIEIEPTLAPSAELQVRDLHGRIVARFALNGRQVVEIATGLAPGGSQALRLMHVEAGVAERDARAPWFRVYAIEWSAASGGAAGSSVPAAPSASLAAPATVRSPGKHEITAPVRLHTNACGDFTLMHRDHWFDLRGYPELEIFSFHLDSVLCYAAHHGGAVEEILPDPLRIYHVEHGLGSGWTPEGQAQLWERIAAKGIPFLEDGDMLGWAVQMRWLNSPLLFNGERWGFAGEDLPETRLGG